MAVLSREEYFTQLKRLLGDDSSEEAIKTLEDFTETYNALEKASNTDIDWEEKYRQNDEAWKKRYMQRFFTGTANITEGTAEENADKKTENITIEDLFTGEEK